MSGDEPGALLVSGVAADIYDVGGDKVLKRFRRPQPAAAAEARVLRDVGAAGLRVPRVHELGPEHDPARDILMDRIAGSTMLQDLERRPWSVIGHARLLARIQRQINEVPAPEWMVPSTGPIVSGGDCLLHMDLQPANVMLTDDGPVVIDWTNAIGGPPGFDAATTFVLLSTVAADGFRDRLVRWLMVQTFRRARGGRELDAFVGAACDHRLADPDISPAERTAVAQLRSRFR